MMFLLYSVCIGLISMLVLYIYDKYDGTEYEDESEYLRIGIISTLSSMIFLYFLDT